MMIQDIKETCGNFSYANSYSEMHLELNRMSIMLVIQSE